jgi:2-C-methyl-D-erythritol 4-phosphate cytidylyltransferase
MKTIAIILAGGAGSRMHADKPKQFIDIDGCPLIVRTARNFETNNRIDSILVVCVNEWVPWLSSTFSKFGITKARWLVPGGNTGHDSARNAIFFLRDKITDQDFVVIHDAARPLLPQKILDSLLDIAYEKGNACASLPLHETIVFTDDQKSGNTDLDRSKIRRIQTPQAYKYGLIYPLYVRAEKEGIHNFVYANTMAIHYGIRIYFSEGFDNNIKITTKDDIPLYESLLKFREDELCK